MAKQEQNLGIRVTDLVEHIEANGYLQSVEATRGQLSQAVRIAEDLRREPCRQDEIDIVIFSLYNDGKHAKVAGQALQMVRFGATIGAIRKSRIQKRRGISQGARTLMDVGQL